MGSEKDLELDIQKKDRVRTSVRPSGAPAAVAVSGHPSELNAPAVVVDPAEAKRLANFGTPPTSLVALPGYVRATNARIEELQREAFGHARRLGKTEQDLAEACWAVAQRVVAKFDSLSKAARAPYQATVQALREVDEGTPEHLAVCADFADFVINDQATFGTEFGEARKRIISLRGLVQSQTNELALYRAAAKAYDAEAHAKGKVVTIAALAAVGVLVVTVILAAVVANL